MRKGGGEIELNFATTIATLVFAVDTHPPCEFAMDNVLAAASVLTNACSAVLPPKPIT